MAYRYVFGLIFLFVGQIYSLNFPDKQPTASIPAGKIIGLYKKSFSGYTYKSFEGIPYALPITNQNRFKEPVLYDQKYQGYLNATAQSAPCLHINHFHKENGEYMVMGDEDCLYLNVYIREDSDPAFERRPVLININPGGFGQTGSDIFSAEYLMDKEKIVLVTFNYRLGPLGFLSTGDAVIPGNMGLKDQVIAMHWVKKHISAFGGDPNKITIIGLSAGGASVQYHMLSPLTTGLFHRAFSLSGSALCPWALILDVPMQTKKLASLVGCPTEKSTDMVECLRERPAHVVVQQIKHFQVWLYNPFTVFGPVIEGTYSKNNFLPAHPADMLTNKRNNTLKDVPYIVSVVEDEGLYPAAEFVFDSTLLTHLEKNWNFIAPHLLFYNHSTDQKKTDFLSQTMKKTYLKGMPIAINSRKELVQMISDRLFIAPCANSAFLVARKNKEPVYFYKYSHLNSVSVSEMLSGKKTVIGAAHGDDFALIIKIKGINNKVTKQDKEMSELLLNILDTFANTGKIIQELPWDRVPTVSKDFKYLNIKSKTNINIIKDANLGNRLNLAKIFKDDKSSIVGGIP